ncbi:glycerol kinase GlpK [Parapusillimonas granuli]|uniref:Glycerol kinase n=1 Tax=Parapusillimonas granuli TaxID=380911 RepID=A0A853FU75_9BURK|nr:glycerol kinase GlpK [Parapusillimonas granuli]MBB5213419.1 glycerol kinase [Parapusillimonas granuli]NYT48258.1 glycerol kinase GlpK [Parapusillimonas granuli]
MTYILALDQGTSSSRSIVFDREGNIAALAQKELTQHYPQPGWVEHDPMEIWRTQLETAREAIAKAGLDASDIACVGITNQRETTVVWNRRTGEPVCRAIVWQDRRSEPMCATLREQGHDALILEKTGLRVDAYFSGTKLRWILDNVPGARRAAESGELAFGTIDSWLIWRLTKGRVHASDVSNASRSMLFDVHRNAWDDTLMGLLGIPPALMPEVLPSSAHYGELDAEWLGRAMPICGVAGDQQSALFGQACFTEGMAKNTYGTGCFMLMHTGDKFQISRNGLVTTSAAQTGGRPEYALEGSVFVAGAVVQWLRDGLGAFRRSSEIEALAQSVPDSGGVMLVPAFTGLGAPYWKPDVRGTITGLTRGSTMAHIARAALESIAFQSAALLQAMSRDAVAAGAAPLAELRVDGGASVNDLLMQFQADLLGIPVLRPTMIETTALGAAYLAGLHHGVYQDKEELSALWRIERRFTPGMPAGMAGELMEKWERAVRQACAD